MGLYPDGYSVPSSGGQYMKFQNGNNHFRILSQPLVGVEYWVDKDGNPREKNAKPQPGDRPVRVSWTEKIPNTANAKFFNAFVVWNYKDKDIEVLEITQKRILNSLLVYDKDPEWGDIRNYDLIVEKSGEGLESEYNVIARPPKPLDPNIKQLFDDAEIHLENLMSGGDPFKAEAVNEQAAVENMAKTVSKKVSEEVNTDDIPF